MLKLAARTKNALRGKYSTRLYTVGQKPAIYYFHHFMCLVWRDNIIAHEQQGMNLFISALGLTVMTFDDLSTFLVEWLIMLYLKKKGMLTDYHL